jgi:hypothetical protein
MNFLIAAAKVKNKNLKDKRLRIIICDRTSMCDISL